MSARLASRPLAVAATLALVALLALIALSSFGDRQAAAQGGYGQRTNTLTLDPALASRPVDTTHAVIATAASGPFPLAGVTIRYSIVGAHPGSGTVVTNGAGQAAIAWAGTRGGDDALIAFADIDGNGERDAAEPVGAASVRWQPGDEIVIRFPRSNRSILVDRRGRFLFRISGTPGARGTASFRTARAVSTAQARRLLVGSRRYAIPSSGRTAFRVRVRRPALAVLRRRGRLPVRATVRVAGVGSTTYSFALRSRSPR